MKQKVASSHSNLLFFYFLKIQQNNLTENLKKKKEKLKPDKKERLKLKSLCIRASKRSITQLMMKDDHQALRRSWNQFGHLHLSHARVDIVSYATLRKALVIFYITKKMTLLCPLNFFFFLKFLLKCFIKFNISIHL